MACTAPCCLFCVCRGTRTNCFPTLLEGYTGADVPFWIQLFWEKTLLPCRVHAAVSHWCHTPNLKPSLIHLHLFHSTNPCKHLCQQLVICYPKEYLLFWTCSCVLGRWPTLNPLLVLLAQRGDGVQPLVQGGWRSRNMRSWGKKPPSLMVP